MSAYLTPVEVRDLAKIIADVTELEIGRLGLKIEVFDVDLDTVGFIRWQDGEARFYPVGSGIDE